MHRADTRASRPGSRSGGIAQGIHKYDYLSLLASRGLPGSSTTLHYMHDLDGNVIAEYDSAGTLLREYVWLDDRPVAAIEPGTPAVIYWVHTDHLERPVMMTDDSANIVWWAKYLPYGEVYSITGPAALDYRFPGQWFQLESGLHYNWHRHDDPTTGRYVQPDPFGMPDGPSRWAYVNNSPTMRTDRRGTDSDLLSAAIGFGAIAFCSSGVGTIACACTIGGALLITGAGIYMSTPVSDSPASPPAADDDDGDRNPQQDKKLSPHDIKKLIAAGHHPHDVKAGHGGTPSQSDLYKDKKERKCLREVPQKSDWAGRVHRNKFEQPVGKVSL